MERERFRDIIEDLDRRFGDFRADRDIALMERLLDACGNGDFCDIDSCVLWHERDGDLLQALKERGENCFDNIRAILAGLRELNLTDELLEKYPNLRSMTDKLSKAASAYVGIDSLATGLTMLFKIDPERAMDRAKEMLKDCRFVAPMVFTVVDGFCGKEKLEELDDFCVEQKIKLQENLRRNFGLLAA